MLQGEMGTGVTGTGGTSAGDKGISLKGAPCPDTHERRKKELTLEQQTCTPAAGGEQRWPRAASIPRGIPRGIPRSIPRSIPRTAKPPRLLPPAHGTVWLNSPAPPLHSCLPAFPTTFSVCTRGCKGRNHQRYFQTL